jgi:hypothetical protein
MSQRNRGAAIPCAFTLYWPTDTWEQYRRIGRDGQLLSYVTSDHLLRQEVMPGDALYVVTLLNVDLLLIGKMIVGKVCRAEEAAGDLDVAPESLDLNQPHAVAVACTPQSWSRVVPVPMFYQLRFQSYRQEYGLYHHSYTGHEYREQLQGLNRLTPRSAALLDTLLPPLLPGPLAYS